MSVGIALDFHLLYLGRGKLINSDKFPNVKTITQEITRCTYEDWPCRGLLPTTNLSVKYAILNIIGISNWSPNNHSSCITTSLSKLIYQIGTMDAFDIGEYVFEKVLKKIESYAVKLTISFPTLIFGILVSQRPGILTSEQAVGVSGNSLTFSYRLFVGIHVPDTSIPNIHFNLTNKRDLPKVPPMSGTTRSNVLLEFMQVSKSLQEMIMVSTTHKNKMDDLIKMTTPKDVGASTSEVAKQENSMTIAEQDVNDNEDVFNASETGSGYVSSGDSEDD